MLQSFTNHRLPQVAYFCRDCRNQLQRDSTVLINTPGHHDLSPPHWTLTTELKELSDTGSAVPPLAAVSEASHAAHACSQLDITDITIMII